MSKSKINFVLLIVLVLAGAVRTFGQTIPPAGSEDKLIAVLKSADASHKEKADACRHLSIIGTKDAVPTLAALLSDEKLSHMARYAMEPIPEATVDDALRDALDKLKGRPLVGVIGSIGVRHDAKAVKPLAKMLQNSDAQVAQAAARALGKIGTPTVAKALQGALEKATAANKLDICEGLFRCAEALTARGRRDKAIEIYDQLRSLKGPHQVRAGGLRGAILTRKNKDGLELLKQQLRNKDYIMFSAAVQAAQEMKGAEVTGALTAELKKLPADNQILVIQTLSNRGEASATTTLYELAKSAGKPVRLAAIRALPAFDTPGLELRELLDDSDSDISKAAQESFAAIPGRQADAAVMEMFKSGDTGKRLTALELMGRRRMTKSIGELLKAAAGPDAEIRPAAIRKVGELGGPDELSALLKLLTDLKESKDLDAAERALSDVCAKADEPQSCTDKLISTSAKAGPAQKSSLLRVLGGVGGPKALKAVRAAVDDSNTQVHATAIRALGSWKTADAAPDLLALARTAGNPNDKTLCLRGYLGLASRTDIPGGERLSMCREAAGLVQRDAEKKLLLGALGGINSPASLALIMPYLDEPATRTEAGTAIVAIAEKLLKGRDAPKVAAKLIEPLEKAAQVTTNAALAQRAKGLLRQAQNKAKSR